jgi:predicted Zn-dependent protease
MAKIGRNDACPCGSGKKYKKCCSPKDERTRIENELASLRAEHEVRLAERDVLRAELEAAIAERAAHEQFHDLSDRISALIKDGHLDDAEERCRKLETDYPDETLGTELLGEVYEARGLPHVAIEHFHRAVARMDAIGVGHYCDHCRAELVKAIRRLDPDGTSPLLELNPV